MLLVVTGVGGLIHVYSLGYMKEDAGFARYFAYLSLFTFSMLGIVLANNFLMMFVFWELVGVSSYLLIGFWFDRPAAADAAKKAFLTNRIGDFGFAIGLFLLWTTYGTLNFHDANGIAGVLGDQQVAVPEQFLEMRQGRKVLARLDAAHQALHQGADLVVDHQLLQALAALEVVHPRT